ncbi:magnesium transport protein CorA [Bacteroidia bacterium]|nr:magnesium transport protein CorA [Bacteroidia bacterium]
MSHRKKNRQLSEIPVYTGQFNTPSRIQLINYSATHYSEKAINSLSEIQSEIQNKEAISWVRVFGMTDSNLIIDLVKSVGLHVLDAKDILTTQHIISLEEYDTNIFIVLPITYSEGNKKKSEQLALILGENYLISIQESDYPLFDDIFSAIKNDIYLKFNNRKSDFLMASILNEVIANYADEVIKLEDELEDIEDQLLDIKHIHTDLMIRIQENRREMIRLRKLLFPFKEHLVKLLRVDPGLICQREVAFFKDIYDQLLYVLQNLESCREILSSLVDLYLNNNDVKMNVVMKQLTLVATIFIPLTFLVGVWGMNFKFMPELDWRYGYLFAWILMLGIGVFVGWYLKKKNWM